MTAIREFGGSGERQGSARLASNFVDDPTDEAGECTDEILDRARVYADLHHEAAEIIGDLCDLVTMWRDLAVAVAIDRKAHLP